jgi:hypothetical protein
MHIPEYTNTDQHRHRGNVVHHNHDELEARGIILHSVSITTRKKTPKQTHEVAHVDTVQHALCNHRDVVQTRKVDIDEKPKEVAVIPMPDTVVDPWTVMIWLTQSVM